MLPSSDLGKRSIMFQEEVFDNLRGRRALRLDKGYLPCILQTLTEPSSLMLVGCGCLPHTCGMGLE